MFLEVRTGPPRSDLLVIMMFWLEGPHGLFYFKLDNRRTHSASALLTAASYGVRLRAVWSVFKKVGIY